MTTTGAPHHIGTPPTAEPLPAGSSRGLDQVAAGGAVMITPAVTRVPAAAAPPDGAWSGLLAPCLVHHRGPVRPGEHVLVVQVDPLVAGRVGWSACCDCGSRWAGQAPDRAAATSAATTAAGPGAWAAAVRWRPAHGPARPGVLAADAVPLLVPPTRRRGERRGCLIAVASAPAGRSWAWVTDVGWLVTGMSSTSDPRCAATIGALDAIAAFPAGRQLDIVVDDPEVSRVLDLLDDDRSTARLDLPGWVPRPRWSATRALMRAAGITAVPWWISANTHPVHARAACAAAVGDSR